MELFSSEEMNNWIGPTGKHVWNIAVQVLHIFYLSKTQQLASMGSIFLLYLMQMVTEGFNGFIILACLVNTSSIAIYDM